MQFSLICGPNIPVSCIILFFAALDLTLITRQIHHWASYLFWPSCFIHPGASVCSPLLFLSSMSDTFRPGGLVSQRLVFLTSYTVHGVLTQVHWGGLPFPPPMYHILSELSAMTHPSWVALHNRAHSFLELCKPLCQNKAVIYQGWRWRRKVKELT